MNTSILHIESDPIVVDAVKDWIGRWPEVNYAGHAYTGKQGIERFHLSRPALVLLEMNLSDMNGLEMAEALVKADSRVRLLVLTRRADEALLHYVAAGLVAGLLWKLPGVQEHLRNAFAEILRGRRYFPLYVQEALQRFRRNPQAVFKILSPRELTLLPLLGRGESDTAIGVHYQLSAATVHSHRQRIMAKLDLHGTPGLMQWAGCKGFSDFPRPAAPISDADWESIQTGPGA